MTFVQRFGGALKLNVRFHTLIPDGVFVVEEGAPTRFVRLPPPRDEDVERILIGKNVTRGSPASARSSAVRSSCQTTTVGAAVDDRGERVGAPVERGLLHVAQAPELREHETRRAGQAMVGVAEEGDTMVSPAQGRRARGRGPPRERRRLWLEPAARRLPR